MGNGWRLWGGLWTCAVSGALVSSCGGDPEVEPVGEPLTVSRSFPALDEVAQVLDVAGAGMEGGVWILDAQAPHLILQMNDGEVAAAFGEVGEGPEELGRLEAIVRATDSEVSVWDVTRQELRTFSVHGDQVASVPLPVLRHTIQRTVLNGSYGDLLKARAVGDLVFVADYPEGLNTLKDLWSASVLTLDRSSGELASDVALGWRGDDRDDFWRELQSDVLIPIPLWSSCAQGDLAIYTPVSDSVRWIDSGRSAVAPRAPRPLEPRQVREHMRERVLVVLGTQGVGQEEAELLAEQIVEEAPEIAFSPLAPAYVRMLCDGADRAWLQRFSLEHWVGYGRAWDVVAADDGRLITVSFPPEFHPVRFSEEGIWGIQRDDFGVERVGLVAVPDHLWP